MTWEEYTGLLQQIDQKLARLRQLRDSVDEATASAVAPVSAVSGGQGDMESEIEQRAKRMLESFSFPTGNAADATAVASPVQDFSTSGDVDSIGSRDEARDLMAETADALGRNAAGVAPAASTSVSAGLENIEPPATIAARDGDITPTGDKVRAAGAAFASGLSLGAIDLNDKERRILEDNPLLGTAATLAGDLAPMAGGLGMARLTVAGAKRLFPSLITSDVGKSVIRKILETAGKEGLGGEFYVAAREAVAELKEDDPDFNRFLDRVASSQGEAALFAAGGAVAGELAARAKAPANVRTGPTIAGETIEVTVDDAARASGPASRKDLERLKNHYSASDELPLGEVAKADAPGIEIAPEEAAMHFGVNPFSMLRNALKKAFGEPKPGQGRRLVNVAGTPEVVLSGRGIVEPFIKAQEKMKELRSLYREKLEPVFEGIKKYSQADQELFTRLDDPNAALKGNEAVLRDHFDSLLSDVNAARARRGEKPIVRRKGYITHLLDYAEQQSELLDDVPQQLKFPYEIRKGGKHKVSAIEATQIYTEAALRDIHLADAVLEAVPKVEALSPWHGRIMSTRPVVGPGGKRYRETLYHFRERTPGTERNYAEQFVMRQLGWPTRMERAVEEVLQISPHTQRKAAQLVTATFYRSLIGAALDTGFKNLTQGINTFSEFGAVPTLKGYGALFTKAGRKVAKDAHLLDDYEPLLYGGELKLGRGLVKKFDDVVLSGPMRFAEFVNRGAAYHAAMDYGLKAGMALEDAHIFGLDSVRKLQFAYGKTHISPHVQGAEVRPLFQFTSYPIKQAELMYRWAIGGSDEQKKLLRYLATTGALVMGGKYLDVDLSGVFFDPLVMVDPESKEGMKLPFSEDRVKFSWDKLVRSGFVPQGPAPVISMPIQAIEVATDKDPDSRKLKLEKLLKIIPNRYAGKLYDIYQDAKRGYRVTGRDRKLTEVTTRDLILRGLGLRSNDWERVSSERDKVIEVEEYYYRQRSRFIDLALDGKTDEARVAFQELADKYPYLVPRFFKSLKDGLVDEAKKKQMSSDERFYESSLRESIRENEE